MRLSPVQKCGHRGACARAVLLRIIRQALYLAQGVAGEGTSAGVSSRVKKLEEKIPELQAKLRKHMKQAPARAGSSGADGLNRRVEVLEDAVDTLLDAEVCLSGPLECPLTTQLVDFPGVLPCCTPHLAEFADQLPDAASQRVC